MQSFLFTVSFVLHPQKETLTMLFYHNFLVNFLTKPLAVNLKTRLCTNYSDIAIAIPKLQLNYKILLEIGIFLLKG